MNLVFATNNPYKLSEIRRLLNRHVISGLEQAGFTGEIPEDFATLEQNACQKAWYIYNRLGMDCFSDDTGLETEALNGEPGVYSARFSRIGNLRFPDLDITEGNIRKLLHLLEKEDNRRARFRTIISLIIGGKEFSFEGAVDGIISRNIRGTGGFGYDPVFIPDGESLSFAEMSPEHKNEISHRGKAIKKLESFLANYKP